MRPGSRTLESPRPKINEYSGIPPTLNALDSPLVVADFVKAATKLRNTPVSITHHQGPEHGVRLRFCNSRS